MMMPVTDHSHQHALSVAGMPDLARTTSGQPGHAEMHELRLALELQIDALLLALTASARDRSGLIPWQRWLAEDLDLAHQLAVTLARSEVDLPSILGGTGSGLASDPLETLHARYLTLADMLDLLLRRPHTGQEWRPAAGHALIRCRTRLDEIGFHLDARLPGARRSLEEPETPRRESYLPGELLG